MSDAEKKSKSANNTKFIEGVVISYPGVPYLNYIRSIKVVWFSKMAYFIAKMLIATIELDSLPYPKPQIINLVLW